jgi:hypothetical protein
MSVRNLQLGFEAVYGVAAAAAFYTALPGTKFNPNRKQNRIKPKIITGTPWEFYESRRGSAEAAWSLEMPLYYERAAYPMALHFGTPITATVVTTAFTSTFKPGTAMLSGTFQYRKVNSQNAAGQWYQMTGCEANAMKLSMSSTGIPIVTFEGLGKYPTAISAPTIANLAIEQYVHPDAATQYIKKANVGWTKVEKLEMDSVRGLAGGWTIQQSTSMSRIQLGGSGGTLKATAFQDAYTGSIMELNDTTGLVPTPGLEIGFIDTVTQIGTTPFTNPSLVITAPLPYTDDANEADSDMDDKEDFSISLAYDPTTTAGWKWVFTHMLPASTWTGH